MHLIVRCFIPMGVTMSLLIACSNSKERGLSNTQAAKLADQALNRSRQVDIDARARTIAVQALAEWVEKNPADAEQIRGASVSEVKQEGDGYHVILVKDNSIRDTDGGVTEGMHVAYFHVYLDKNLQVIKVERGPDEVS